ncbi:hypothetical protein OHB26_38685 (plasmid) [Nocardia sp. NBC_01503]|uniref:hypothetical protein n=1 Tax=Nocardia sp. NBC_01503 TaxID=2975997 RepID=UPI002E7BC1EB|nr:hypothetical protein [Nocardia sp. NBC_01503]WTL36605.1 hypothetical protein OHB26_38685 [Nocardia sp. NBC_01503]
MKSNKGYIIAIAGLICFIIGIAITGVCLLAHTPWIAAAGAGGGAFIALYTAALATINSLSAAPKSPAPENNSTNTPGGTPS